MQPSSETAQKEALSTPDGAAGRMTRSRRMKSWRKLSKTSRRPVRKARKARPDMGATLVIPAMATMTGHSRRSEPNRPANGCDIN
jgi:hypothetical protein